MPGVIDLLLVATGGSLSTITLPTEAEVKFGTPFGEPGTLTGQLVVPVLDDVLTTATAGAPPVAGHYLAPGVAVVKDGEFFGVDSAEEGSYVGGGGGGGVPLIGDGGLVG